MSKIRVLFTGEASFLSTGFATFNREIIKRLYETGKYEIAEMGSYASAGDPRCEDVPWRFYPVLPSNEAEKRAYDSNPVNAFGAYKIDAVLADFQPDIVFDARDPWMMQHLVKCKFRDNFKLFLMPTVDSAPQKKQWVDEIFKKADVVTTYSRYGRDVLLADGVKVHDVTSPGIDLDVFKPLDRKEVRDSFHVTPSLFIFGTVMRNQKRKLFPDLFDAYARLRRKYSRPSLISRAKKKTKDGKTLTREERAALRIFHSALYCHTSYPDLGWDLPHYIYSNGIQRHTIFTYLCDSCDAVYASWFTPSDKKGMAICRECGEHTAHMPNTHKGVDEKDLVRVFNMFDTYIQPAICEGWGLPIVESKACGVPGIYQNYSAMEDHVQNGGGLELKIGRFYHEPETSAVRSLPSVEDLVQKMERLALNDKERKRLGSEARQCCVDMHEWSASSKKIEDIFDSLELLDRSKTWDSYPSYEFMNTENPPANMDDQSFIAWCYVNILHRIPDKEGFDTWNAKLQGGGNRQEILNFFRDTTMSANRFEQTRWESSLKLRDISETIVSPEEEVDNFIPGVTL
jgi:glycosyltransferase involved in cell wall biosynthesis